MNLLSFSTAKLVCCSFVSGLKIRSVEAQPGEDVKLLCSNFSTIPARITWFRVTNTSHLYHIASMFESQKDIKNGEGFSKEKFIMSSNMSVIFLTIKTVNVSDSGLYFCGYYVSRNPTIIEATHVEVQGKNPHFILQNLIMTQIQVLHVPFITLSSFFNLCHNSNTSYFLLCMYICLFFVPASSKTQRLLTYPGSRV
uniref:Ig-like domain-containing protein n=1 Tax=Salarias fasciatus TaxID=181472 RepID=A0A672IHP4_SALFA